MAISGGTNSDSDIETDSQSGIIARIIIMLA